MRNVGRHRAGRDTLTVTHIQRRLLLEARLPDALSPLKHVNEGISAAIRYGEALLRSYGVSI